MTKRGGTTKPARAMWRQPRQAFHPKSYGPTEVGARKSTQTNRSKRVKVSMPKMPWDVTPERGS